MPAEQQRAFAAIKAALEQCAEEVGADFGPEERQWINRIRDGALRRLELRCGRRNCC